MQFRLVYIVLLGLILPLFAQSQQVRIALCYDSTSFERTDYRVAIGKSVVRSLSYLELDLEPDVRFRSCLMLPSFSFYASEEAIFGREEAMVSLVQAAYWMAAVEALNFNQHENVSNILNNCRVVDWVDIFRLAKLDIYNIQEKEKFLFSKIAAYSSLDATDLRKAKKLVQKLHEFENDIETDLEEDITFAVALLLYQYIMDNATAFFIGHELYHFYGNSFMPIVESKIEQSGFFKSTINLQLTEGKLLDPSFVQADKDEILADLNGLRVLEVVDRVNARLIENDLLAVIARRASIDLIAFPLLCGFDIWNVTIDKPMEVLVTPGYLYPEIRIFLSSAVLHQNESQFPWAVKICGNTSKGVLETLFQHASSYEAGDGYMPDELLELVPKGFTTGMETNYWDEDSYKCLPGQ